MTVMTPEGTDEVTVPKFMRTQPTLSQEQLVEMARLAITLEQQMGWPVDMESAYQGDDLYLLQCRLITTLTEPGDAWDYHSDSASFLNASVRRPGTRNVGSI